MNESLNPETIEPMANFDKQIGKRIRRIRESVPGRTQTKFAAILGVSRGAVGNWEVGKGASRENLALISRVTRVPIDWIINGPDDDGSPIPFQIEEPKEPSTFAKGDEILAAVIFEVLVVNGITPQRAGQFVATIERVVASNLPEYPGLTRAETAQMIVRRLAEGILSRPPESE